MKLFLGFVLFTAGFQAHALAQPVEPSAAAGEAGPALTLGEISARTPPAIRALTAAERVDLGAWQAQASTAVSQQRWSEAIAPAERTLALVDVTYGPDHPEALVWVRELEVLHRFSGQAAQALPYARRSFDLSRRLLGETHRDTLIGLGNVATNLYALGRSAEAEPIDRRVMELRTAALGERHPDTLASLANLASNLGALGHRAEAEQLNRRAVLLMTEVLGEWHPATITTLNNLATDLGALGRPAEAEQLNRRVLALRTEVLGEKHPDTIVSRANLATNLDALGRYAEAEQLARDALAQMTEVLGERHPTTIATLGNLASNLYAQGRPADAEPLYQQVLVLRTEVLGESHPDTIKTVSNLAAVLDTLGRSAEAEALNRRALALMTEALGETHPSIVVSNGNLGMALLSQPGRAALALEPARAAADAIRRTRAITGDNTREETQRSRDSMRQQAYFALLANADWSAGLAMVTEAAQEGLAVPDTAAIGALRLEAFAALQDAMTGSTSEALGLQAARRVAGEAGLGDLASERQRLSEEWRANDLQQADALGTGGAAGLARLSALRARAGEIESRLAAIDAELKAKAPDYYSFVRPEALRLEPAQALLAPGEAVLMVLPTPFGTHLMVVSGEGLAWTRSVITESEVRELVGKLRHDLDPSGQEFLSIYDRRSAWLLYQALIAPVARALAGNRELFIAVSGDLAALPFGVLVSEAPQGDDEDPRVLRDTHWFADDFAITQIPSLQSLAFLRTERRAERPVARAGTVAFAGFGNPVLSDEAMQRGAGSRGLPAMAALMTLGRARDGSAIADVSRLRELPSLPGTGDELEALARALGAPPSALRLREADTERAVRQADLTDVRVLSFATHGLMAGEGGAAEPGLVFTPPASASEEDDGLLTASEVTTLLLDADWAILSACNTAAPNGEGEPGLSGLARAFFYAGARSLLASHWQVRDDVAAELTVATIEARLGNPAMSKAQALQQAMRAIRNDASDPSRAHPTTWAPFSLVGENR